MVEESVIVLLNSLAFTALVFFPIYLSGSYLVFFMAYFITTCIGVVLGYFIAAASPNLEIANAALPAYCIMLLFFVGLVIRTSDVPGYWRWFVTIDLMHYAWVAQMINQFQGVPVYIFLDLQILDFYNITTRDTWLQLGYESLFFIFFFLAAWAALTFIRHQKR